jgi:uncharacterized protein YdhG (YjbR/CyaY superfamily)
MSNMFKPVSAKTIAQYFAALPPERRALIRALDAFIRKTVPRLKPHFAYNMLGYGAFPYRDHKKRLISWPVVALASQKNYVSVYVCALDGRRYVAEKYAKELGKVSVGKSCIRFKRMEDLHLPTLTKVLRLAAKHPGIGVNE